MKQLGTSAYYTTREAAEMLGISLRTAQLWVESGQLEAWKTQGGHRRISAESVERLQRARPGAQTDASRALAPYTDRLRMLIVDDDPLILRFYKAGVARWNLPVDADFASNGYEALLHIGRDSPDLLITDLRMPGIDGFQMLRALAGSPFREGMEIIIVTALRPEDIAREGGLPAGIRVFEKPAPMATLRAAAAQLLDRRAALADTVVRTAIPA